MGAALGVTIILWPGLLSQWQIYGQLEQFDLKPHGSINELLGGEGANLALKNFLIVTQRSGQTQHGNSGFALAACQNDELLIGGGFFGNPGMQVTQSIPSGSSWAVTYQYPGNIQGDAQAYAICIASR